MATGGGRLTATAADGSDWTDWVLRTYTPRRVCMYEELDVVWSHVVADAAIAVSYFSIPLALAYFVRRRRDLAFNWVFWMFAGFILLCGVTHVFGVWAIWMPLYRLDGWVKLATGAMSLATAGALWWLIPRALELPGPGQWRETTRTLRASNTQLAEANVRLAAMRDALEVRVAERTAALEDRNVELRRQVAARERADRVKDAFISTLSHELRTPLNAVMGWTEVLEEELTEQQPDRESLAESAATIRRNAEAQARLVDDLLDISRIRAGRLYLVTRPVAASAFVREAADTVRPAASAKGVELVVDADDAVDTPPVVFDPDRMRQVVWNLLSNAVKFTPAGGEVRVRASRDDGGPLRIVVRDTGRGVAAEDLSRLFLPFEQAGTREVAAAQGGLGLGLAIVKGIVELHGGTIHVRSDGPGTGSTFTVDLPASQPPTPDGR